jgi:glycosyltransferase involved in cell wall biosynthesis
MITIIIPNHNEPRINETVFTLCSRFPGIEIIVITDHEGRGKGWAIREGFKKVQTSIFGYIDGDMDIHPRMINRLMPYLEDYDIVVGKKRLSGSLGRRILTFLSRIYIKVLFNLDVDTQTGIKLFKTCAVKYWKTDGWAFDIEILAQAKRDGFSMIEVPVDAIVSKKMPFKSILGTFKDTIRIWYDRNSGKDQGIED